MKRSFRDVCCTCNSKNLKRWKCGAIVDHLWHIVSLFQQASTKTLWAETSKVCPRCNRFLPECSQCPSLSSLTFNVVWRGGHGGRQGCVGWHRTAREPRGSAAIIISALRRARDHIINWTLSGSAHASQLWRPPCPICTTGL